MRLRGDYAEFGFAPKRWGWEESAPEVHMTSRVIAQLRSEGYALHTWTRGLQIVTFAMEGDSFIHSAYLDDHLLGTSKSVVNGVEIDGVLDLMESNPARSTIEQSDGSPTPRVIADAPPADPNELPHAADHQIR